MDVNHFLLCCLVLVFSITGCEQKENPPPNIVYILADDLGYGEVGAFGQQLIQTPNIDALANEGMKLTQHYSGSPVCAPSRYMLLTGLHPGHAFIRGNHEWGERGDVWNYKAAITDSTLEGQYPIPPETFTTGKMLQSVGYKTGLVGKWGLGAPGSEGDPTKQGFDFFYGFNCQRQAHNLYPKHLWKNMEKVWLDNKVVAPGTKLDSTMDQNDPENYAVFSQKEYAPALMTEEALTFLEENSENPFFLYFASPLPHLPLQAPKELVEKYRELLGPEEPYPGGRGYFPTQHPRATYAAMIEYLDMQVGAIITKLKELDQYDNTLIIFSSDNGATYDVGGVDPHYFNSSGPFKTGRGWGKGYTKEGGMRVPTIAFWKDKIEAGSSSEIVSAFWDTMPTLAAVSGAEITSEIDGINILPTLLGKTENQASRDYLYWEFPSYGGQQAVRLGEWKAIRNNIKDGNTTLELYNLDADIREEIDVAEEYPEMVLKMEQIMEKEHRTATLDRFKMEALGDL